jgi:hypothetical protein
LFACGAPAPDLELGTTSQELGTPIYFQIVGLDDAAGTMNQARASAIVRFRAATCLNIKPALVPMASVHRIMWAAQLSEPGRIGQTTGSWPQVLIKIRSDLQQPPKPNAAQASRTLIHEFYHTLARRNVHCADGIAASGAGHWNDLEALIDECALDRVCAASGLRMLPARSRVNPFSAPQR